MGARGFRETTKETGMGDASKARDGGGQADEEWARRERRRDAVRARIVQDFHVESAFVGVPKLSKILGLAPATIYGYMRQGKFFIPYRMFNTSPMVSLEDLVDWHCSGEGVEPAAGAAPVAPEPPRRGPKPSGAPIDPEAEADRIVAEALAAVGVDPSSRRPGRRGA